MHMENYHLAKSSATTTSPRLPAPTQHPSGQGLPAITFNRSRQRCAFSKTMGDSFGSLICFQHYSAFFLSFWCWSSSLFFFFLGLVFKFISSEGISFFWKQFWAYFGMWIYQNTFLYKLLNSFTPKILHLYLVTDSKSQPNFVSREITKIDAYRRKTSLIHIRT